MVDTIINSFEIWTDAQGLKSRGRVKSIDNISLEGIAQLRGLILELAIEGKLTIQDPDDEHANKLLKRIETAKRKLERDKKISKHKQLPKVAKNEERFGIPNSWVWTRLGSITQINPRNDVDDETSVSFVPMSLISTAYNGEHDQEERLWKDISKGFTHFSDGDIGLAKITPCFENSKAVVFKNLKNGMGAGTTELHIARPYGDTIDAQYILLNLKSPSYLSIGESKMTGTAGQKRVPRDFFSEYPIPLPPIEEQKRIVAKVEELMALCDQLEVQQTNKLKTHQQLVKTLLETLTRAEDADEVQAAWQQLLPHFDTLFCTEDSIEQFKQAVLQLAIKGRLVKQDRNDGRVSSLIEKIGRRKEYLIEKGVIKRASQLPEVSQQDLLQNVPSGWCYERLGNIVRVINGRAYKRHEMLSEGTPLLRVGNLFTSKEWYYSDLELESEKYIDNGDLIYAWSASFGPFIWEGGKAIYHYHIWKLDFFLEETYDKNFLYLYLSAITQDIKASGNGIAMIHMTKERMEKLVVPFPPILEQKRIVAKVEQLMALCNQLKNKIIQSQEIQNTLSKTIVENALA